VYSSDVLSQSSFYKFSSKWGSSGTGDGQFSSPWGIAVDNAGNVYVADSANNRVQKFDSSNAFVTKWGALGNGNGQFYNPHGIAVDNIGNAVYVVDSHNHLIQKFSLDGEFITQWGSLGRDNGQFSWPVGIAVDAAGNVYVTDLDARIQKFSSSGEYITQWGSHGTGNGQFVHLHGIAVGPDGYVYVADWGNHRIQKFSSTGSYIAKWGTYGSENGQLEGPRGVAIDASGNIYVTETGNNRVQKFTADGVFVTKWGNSGSGDGQFSNAIGIAVDAVGNVYVVDDSNSRIQKFAPDNSMTLVGDSSFIRGTACNNNVCVAVGGTTDTTKIYVSTDLSSWTEKYSLEGTFYGNVAFVGNNAVAFFSGYDAIAGKTTIKMIRSSDNGNTWGSEPVYSETLTGVGGGGVTTLNDAFVAFIRSEISDGHEMSSNRKILFSSDGITWVPKRSETFTGHGGMNCAFGNNTYVISTYVWDRESNTTSLKVHTSNDNGNTWNERTLPVATLQGNGGMGVVFGNGAFVAYATAAISGTPPDYSSTFILFSSTDNGGTWTETYSGTGGFSSVSFGNNTFVIACSLDAGSGSRSIKTLTSTNGTTWAVNDQPLFQGSLMISYLNNSFIASSGTITCTGPPPTGVCVTYREIFLSNDGVTWEKKYSDSTLNPNSLLVIYCLGSYITYGSKDGMGFVQKLPLSGGSGGTISYTLTVTKSGTGSGTVSATGLSCSSTVCTGTYESGTQISLVATAAAGSTFTGWSGSGCSGTGTCVVTIDAAKSVIATFTSNSADTCQVGFAEDGSMSSPRNWHTATYLQTGKVLIVGGGSADLYDPDKETFTKVNSAPTKYAAHTATLLNNGMVLMTGGNNPDGSDATDVAQWYDPISNTFGFFGNMTTKRSNHTATLLADGKVLVVGGNVSWGAGGDPFYPTASAEIFDPKSGSFSATGSMSVARASHIAELLPDGKVLIAGGSNYYNYLNTAEIYDPSTGQFTPAGNMTTGRAHGIASARLPNGKILVTGGYIGSYLKSAEIFDPVTKTFSATGNMAEARRRHAMSLLPDGSVLVVGGENNAALRSAEIYNPSSGTFASIGNMSVTRTYFTATPLAGGKVLIAGGTWDSSTKTEIYNSCLESSSLNIPLTSGWNFISFPSLPTDESIDNVLKDISSNVRIIWGYDNTNKAWKRYKPGVSDNTLTTIEGGKGYWVYMNASGNIDMTGWTDQSKTVPLAEGWNLVGYNGADNTDVATALNGISGKWSIVWYWKDNQWYAKHESSNLSVPVLDKFKKGGAYWIKTGQATDWVQP